MTPTILLLSGPNLNLLGEREPEIYGTTTLADLVQVATDAATGHGYALEHVQSNHEGDLVDAIHGARDRCAAIVINPGAFGHYAYAIADALAHHVDVRLEDDGRRAFTTGRRGDPRDHVALGATRAGELGVLVHDQEHHVGAERRHQGGRTRHAI